MVHDRYIVGYTSISASLPLLLVTCQELAQSPERALRALQTVESNSEGPNLWRFALLHPLLHPSLPRGILNSQFPCQSRLRISILKVLWSRSICAGLLIIKKQKERQNAKKGLVRQPKTTEIEYIGMIGMPMRCIHLFTAKILYPTLQFHATSPSFGAKPISTLNYNRPAIQYNTRLELERLRICIFYTDIEWSMYVYVQYITR